MITEECIKIPNPFTDKEVIIYDLEVYPNYFLSIFQEESGIKTFTVETIEELKQYISDKNKVLISYNGLSYDDLILKAIKFLGIKDEFQIFELSKAIIERSNDELYNRLKWRMPSCWHRSVDLMNLCFKDDTSDRGIAGLKDIMIRMQMSEIQDLPYSPEKHLTDEEKETVLNYCKKDISATVELWKRLYKHVSLRLELERLYEVDCTSLSEPQTCEAIFKELYLKESGLRAEQLKELKSNYENITVTDLIPSYIEYETPELSELLTELKGITLNIRENIIINKSELKRKITIGNKKYAMGIGGLHSEDKPGIYKSTDELEVIDVDVTSYYPAIIDTLELRPGHLTGLWTDILRRITKERIQAKKENPLKAQALKIIINSAFGKTGNPYSFMYDIKLMLTVTITGQLLLLLLAEKLNMAGIEVISGNTDGLTLLLPVDKRNAFKSILEGWQALTGLNLEETKYLKYVRRDVNNYIALTDKGDKKRKGIFVYDNLFKKNDAPVIPKLLEDYFLIDRAPEQSLKDHKLKIYDFLLSYKANRGFTVYRNGSALQKTNRWYISKDGIKLDKVKDDKRIKVSDSVIIANSITDDRIPGDIDLNYYIRKVKEVIFQIENPEKAECFRRAGLSPIPKEEKKNPAGARLNKIKTDWNFSTYTGIGTYTGLEAGIISFDFDDPEICKIYDLLEPSFTIWHGEGSASDVLSGKKRGAILYKYTNEKIRSTDGNFLKRQGIEILYGGKTQQITGFHTSGEEYRHSGELQPLPIRLEAWLEANAPKRKKSKKKAVIEPSLFDDIQDPLETLKKILREDPDLQGWQYEEITGEDIPLKLQGFCPYSDDHTGQSNNSNFSIFITENDNIFCSCFHQNCNPQIEELKKRLNERWQDLKQEQFRRQVIHNLRRDRKLTELNDILKAFYQPGRCKLIQAPTGTGKTHNSVTYFLDKILNEQAVIYCTTNKTSMAEFVECLEDRTGRELSDILVQELKSGTRLDDLEDPEDEEEKVIIQKSTVGIITHFTYFSRRGISDLFYSVIRWIEENKAVVIIDEIDSYVQAQSCIIPIECRYRRMKPKGSEFAYYYRRNKCGSFNGRFSCGNCQQMKLHNYEVNKYHVPIFYHLPKVKEEFTDNPLEMPHLRSIKEMFLPEKGLSIQLLEQHKDLLRNKIYRFFLKDNENYDFHKSITDMVECAHNPVIYQYTPMINGEPADPENVPDEERHKIKFPYQLCNVSYLSLKDKAVPAYISKNAKEIILLSATVSQADKEYLKDAFGEIQELSITASTQKIDELLLIGFSKSLKYIRKGVIELDFLQEYGKTLIFEPSKSEAIALYNKLPRTFPGACYKQDDIILNQKYSDGWKYLITHSRGAMGRAVNLPEFYTCFVNSTIYKPSNCYDLKKFTPEEIRARQQDDRLTTSIQNSGRILRGTGRKVICISYTIPEEIQYFKDRFQLLVKNEILTKHFEVDQDALMKTINHYHKTGEVLEVEEVKPLDKAKEDGLSALSQKQRKVIAEEYKDEKQKDQIEQKILLAKILKDKGMAWYEIYKSLNLNRLKKEEVAKIKSLC